MIKYPLWKHILVFSFLIIGVTFSIPNIYPPDPAVQISGENSSFTIDDYALEKSTSALLKKNIKIKSSEINDNKIIIRLYDRDKQLASKKIIQDALGLEDYIVALNLAPTTPNWLKNIGASPLKLGLDLSGGVHFLMEVDTNSAIDTKLRSTVTNFKRLLRKEKIRGLVKLDDSYIIGRFNNEELRDNASNIAFKEIPEMTRRKYTSDNLYFLELQLSDNSIKELEDESISQNLITIRNRVNELGVSEPLVQRQGKNRIVVELPGVQDTVTAKRILGKTANLEFRLAASTNTNTFNRETFEYEGMSVDLERDIIVTGESVAGAQFGFDENSRPQVSINLDSSSGQLMHRITRNAVKRKMAVLFIERKTRKIGSQIDDNGEKINIYEKYDHKKVINLATIQTALGSSFRITGLDNQTEAAELALLLRAGALAAPMEFVEERTIGPSLGAENIALGVKSVIIGLTFVVLAMLIIYKVFGFVANLALAFNLILIVAIMSLLSATLTLPGIAGIVLTVGMAVDANVLIFSRIREELSRGQNPQLAISTGYDKAFLTILDANITTLIAAIILYSVGTGPIKGFAITLSIGIVTSMFTAIIGTRALVSLIYNKKTLKQISI